MLDLKTWLQTTGKSVAEDKFFSVPALPYIVYLVDTEVTGADEQNLISTRNVTVELYAQRIDLTSESAIEGLMDAKAFSYSKSREWIASENFFRTTYDFSITERK